MLEYDESGGALEVALGELLRHRLVDDVLVPAPAVGAEWVQAVAGGETWELLAVDFLFTTSAVVNNRSVKLQALDQNGNELWRLAPQAVQVAALGVRYSWLPGLGSAAGVDGQQIPMPTPPTVLQSGWTIGSLTALRDPGDAFTAIVVTARRWSPQRIALSCDWLTQRPRSAR